jgi:hypothetical protein
MTSELVALLAGAVLSGAVQALLAFFERRQERESTLTAVAAEVKSIRELIDHNGYRQAIGAAADAVRKGSWDGRSISISITQNYFSVFEALGDKISLIEPSRLGKIVSFYAYCRALIDGTRIENFTDERSEQLTPAVDMLQLEGLVASIEILSDQITGMPKKRLGNLAGE